MTEKWRDRAGEFHGIPKQEMLDELIAMKDREPKHGGLRPSILKTRRLMDKMLGSREDAIVNLAKASDEFLLSLMDVGPVTLEIINTALEGVLEKNADK